MTGEISIGGVYLPSILLLAVAAVILTGIATRLLAFAGAYRAEVAFIGSSQCLRGDIAHQVKIVAIWGYVPRCTGVQNLHARLHGLLVTVLGMQRIVTFIGVGLLMLVIGYFVPLPPRRAENAPPPRQQEIPA